MYVLADVIRRQLAPRRVLLELDVDRRLYVRARFGLGVSQRTLPRVFDFCTLLRRPLVAVRRVVVDEELLLNREGLVAKSDKQLVELVASKALRQLQDSFCRLRHSMPLLRSTLHYRSDDGFLKIEFINLITHLSLYIYVMS